MVAMNQVLPWALQAAMAASVLKDPMSFAQGQAAKGIAPPPTPAAIPTAAPALPPTGLGAAMPSAVQAALPTAMGAATPAMLGATPATPAVAPPAPAQAPIMPLSGGDPLSPEMSGAVEHPGTGGLDWFGGKGQSLAQAFGAIRPPTASPEQRLPAYFGNIGGGFRPGVQQIIAQMLMGQPPAAANVPSLGALIRGAA